MLVYIGPYKTWFGPYQLMQKFYWLLGEERCDRIADRLPQGPFEWWDRRKKRQIHIEIHRYDTWSMDNTLAHIIHPMLIQLKETKMGSPVVDDEDVPDELKRTNAPPTQFEWETDDNFHKRWDYVLDEMIWAFSTKIDDIWEDQFIADSKQFGSDEYKKALDRIDNGIRLFGKYYTGLWD